MEKDLYTYLLLCYVVIFWANIFAFAWSIWGAFRNPLEGQWSGYSWLKVISIGGWCSFIYFTYELYNSSWINFLPLILSFSMSLFSSFLFIWTFQTTRNKKLSLAFSKDLPQFLHNRGPYRYLRHPFYFSYLCNYYSLGVVNFNLWILIPLFFFTLIYLWAIRVEEKKLLESSFGSDYKKYRDRVGMFYPRFR